MNFDLENVKDFVNQIDKLTKELIRDKNYDTKRSTKTNAIESRYFERKDRLNSYKKWLKTFDLGRKQGGVRSLLSKAKKQVEIEIFKDK